MLYPDLVDVSTEVFGGYCPAIPPAVLPPGAASIAQDVMFPMGALRTRGGLKNYFSQNSPIPGNASINGLKSYFTPSLGKRLLAWDSLGNFYKENPQQTLTRLFSRPYGNLLYQSTSIFGREYQAFFNALGGFDIPRQYDDTNWDRVSQVGPGVAPTVADEVLSYNLVASPNGLIPIAAVNITAVTENGNIVTVTLAAALPLGTVAGDKILIAGVATGGYNGTFLLATIAGNRLSFTYINPTINLAADATGTAQTGMIDVFFTVPAWGAQAFGSDNVKIAGAGVATYNANWPLRGIQIPGAGHVTIQTNLPGLAASGNGTIAAVGNIAAGRHGVTVAFITRQGFITMPAVPPTFWTAAGNLRAITSNIITGPPNIVARLLIFTPVIVAPATTGSFYSLPNGSAQIGTGSVMLIPDNVTTVFVADFSDAVLIAGFQANYLFTQIELGESAFTAAYNSRGVWLGERNKLQNMVNLTFEGGFQGNVPAGWILDPVNGAGGSSALAGGLPTDWGDAYAITGDGATAIRGKITQSAYQDYLKVAIVGTNTSYSVRARIARNAALAQGTLHINLQSTVGGFTTVGIAVTAAQVGLTFTEFAAVITAPLAIPPNDLLLQVYADGTPTNTGAFIVDSIELFPTNVPFNYSTARFSHAFNPESFDATTGQLQIRPNDGQQLRAGFPLRNNFYVGKDHYLAYVSDDGVNEPASWVVSEVSATIGICGPNACDWTEEWAVFAERSGVYVCWGGDPVKISQEIQYDASGTGKISWNSINWAAAHTIFVRIDKVNKIILIGVPVNGATAPNAMFMLDYQWLEGGADIASSPMVTYSAFTGKILAHGRGRRWALWNITANCLTFAERADGTAQPFFGNGSSNGKIYEQLDCAIQPSDDGAAVPWMYQGYGCPSGMEEQMLQLGAHRKLFGYLKFRVAGVGLLPLGISTTQRSTLLRSYTLSLSPAGDGERPLNIHAERAYFTIRQNSIAGNWFQMERACLCVKKDAMIPVRGVSA